MTVNTTASEIEYTGNGVSTVFPVPFLFPENGDLVVIRVDAAGNSTTLVLGTDYTVSGAGNAAGGSVTLTVPLAVGVLLSISRNLDVVQETDLRNQGKFYQQTIEDSFDYLTMLIQQAFSWLGRALVRPIGKNYYDAEGHRIANLGDPQDGSDAANKNWVGSLISQIQGPINNAANILFMAPDGSPHVVQDLSGSNGASLVGTIQSGTGAVAETLLSAYRRAVYPEQFGASVGAGGDDSAAIQAALDRGAGGQVLLTPGKTYLLGSSVMIPSNTTLIAYGAHIKRLFGINNLIRNKGDGTTGGYAQNTGITILGGLWDANDALGGNCTVIGFHHSNNIQIRFAKIDNPTAWHHLELNGCQNAHVSGCTFVNGASLGLITNEALQIDMNLGGGEWPWEGPADGTRCQSIFIMDCYFESVGSGVGTHTSTAGGVSHARIFIHNCVFTNYNFAGIHAMKWSSVRITDCYFQGGYHGIWGEMSNSNIQTDWQIIGNTFYQLGTTSTYAGTSGRAISANGIATAYVRGFNISRNSVIDHTHAKVTHAIGLDYAQDGTVSGNNLYNINRAGYWGYGQKNVVVSDNVMELTNVSATAGMASIMMGNTGAVDTDSVIVRGNKVPNMVISQCNRALVQGNITDASGITQSGNTNSTVSGNLQGNVYA